MSSRALTVFFTFSKRATMMSTRCWWCLLSYLGLIWDLKFSKQSLCYENVAFCVWTHCWDQMFSMFLLLFLSLLQNLSLVTPLILRRHSMKRTGCPFNSDLFKPCSDKKINKLKLTTCKSMYHWDIYGGGGLMHDLIRRVMCLYSCHLFHSCVSRMLLLMLHSQANGSLTTEARRWTHSYRN